MGIPRIQLAFDSYLTSEEVFSRFRTGAVELADAIEVGGRTFFNEGLKIVSQTRALYPDKEIVFDTKMNPCIFPVFAKMAFDAGADSVITTYEPMKDIMRGITGTLKEEQKAYVSLELGDDYIPDSTYYGALKDAGIKNIIYHSPQHGWGGREHKILRELNGLGLEFTITNQVTAGNMGDFAHLQLYSIIVGAEILDASDPVGEMTKLKDALCTVFH